MEDDIIQQYYRQFYITEFVHQYPAKIALKSDFKKFSPDVNLIYSVNSFCHRFLF